MAVKSASRPPSRSARPASRSTAAPPRKLAAGGHAAERAGKPVPANAAAIKDPRFRQAMEKLKGSAAKARAHEPAAKKAAQAEAAARPPPNERMAGAQANKVGDMGAAPTGTPKPASFLETLRAAIREVMPKKTEDAKDFMKGDDRGKLQGALNGNIEQQKADSTADMKAAADTPPDTGRVPEQPATPMPEMRPGVPSPIGAAQAMPPPKTGQEVSFDKNKGDTDKLMTDNELTTTQLNKANDPRFSAVVQTKSAADSFADRAPGQYRGKEQGALATAQKQATGDEHKGLAGFLAQGAKSAQKVHAHQLTAQERDEKARKDVADHIQSIFDRTKSAVDQKLASLDNEVAAMFDKGVDDAIARMKDYVETRFDDRYSGISGKARWLKDKLLPLPDSVKQWFDEAHEQFTHELDALVVRVASLVETRLAEAKKEIARGQQEIRDYVAGLPANLKSAGEAAEREMNARFDELRQSVEDKKGDLARSLAQRYKEATEKGDKALQDLRDAHKSLYEKVRDAVLTVVKILREFKDRVLALLRKAASVIGIIVSDPIAFLGNILAAIKLGLSQFVDNIWTHLKAGFMSWLFGSLGDAGITLPKDLSLPSILQLVLQVLGVTYERLRAKAVKLIGERNVGLIENVAGAIKTLVTEGPAKLWENVKEYLSNLKEMIIDAIQDWIITTIIKAAVTKLVTMFNPVGAIIQAILTIYNVVMFLIENINKILAFVEAVTNSVADIARGAIGTAANWIENALAKTIPLMIAFLARLLGISGITDKIVSTIKKVQSKVDQAIDKVIGKIIAVGGKLFGAAKAGVAKVVEWWKQKKPFKTAAGMGHEIYYTGDQKNLTTMVASKDPQPVENKLAHFTKQVGDLNTSDQKTAKNLITKVQTALKKDPNDSSIVDDMKTLFELFEDTSATAKTTVYKSTTGSLGGETVGMTMTIDWLDSKFSKTHPGSPPKSGVQDPLMMKLVTDPKERSADKFIRGHLLNENLGGEGIAGNLFPITANANSQHLHSTESKIKKWVEKPNHWARYEVRVNKGSVKLSASDISENYVNSTFECRVVLKDAAGKETESFLTSITSKYEEKKKAATFTMK